MDTRHHHCSYCGHDNAELLRAEERMLGRGESFEYTRCLGCGAMELAAIPADLGSYYPDNYYSFVPAEPKFTPSGWRAPLLRMQYRATVFGTGGLGSLLARRKKSWMAVDISRWLKHSPVRSQRARVLDVGCGNGLRLCSLHEIGYSDLTGVDPFVPANRQIRPGLRVLKQQLSETQDGPYDLIMLHHSLEHMPNHAAAMADIHRLLSSRGACLVRIPMAGGRPHAKYGNRWVEWDAPRHLVLHTETSFRHLAMSAGFRVIRVDWDSDRFAYWASELYERDLSLVDSATGKHRDPADHFSEAELTKFDELAAEDNRLGQASRAAFWLMKASH